MQNEQTTNDSFMPVGYEAPKTGGKYLKLEKGENKFRILSKPIIGWEDWKDNKPMRSRMNDKPSPHDPTRPVKHFWAFTVWCYKTSEIKVMEITQRTIQSAIETLSKDSDWGSPFGYDLKIIRSGEGMETEYQVNPAPHKPLHPNIELAKHNTPINLDALYSGGDPFEVATLNELAKEDRQAKIEQSVKELDAEMRKDFIDNPSDLTSDVPF